MDYWKECVEEAFEEAKIIATKEQIAFVAEWVEGAFENFSMANGYENIPNPLLGEIDRLKVKHEEEVKDLEYQTDVYKRSVARRRGVNESDVYIENGSVYYNL